MIEDGPLYPYQLFYIQPDLKNSFDFRFLTGIYPTSNPKLIVVDRTVYKNKEDIDEMVRRLELSPKTFDNAFYLKYLEVMMKTKESFSTNFAVDSIGFEGDHEGDLTIATLKTELLLATSLTKKKKVMHTLRTVLNNPDYQVKELWVTVDHYKYRITNTGGIREFRYTHLGRLNQAFFKNPLVVDDEA